MASELKAKLQETERVLAKKLRHITFGLLPPLIQGPKEFTQGFLRFFVNDDFRETNRLDSSVILCLKVQRSIHLIFFELKVEN